MRILGLETTCDETGAAVVEGDAKSGIKLLSNVVATSADLQEKYGGVVPEVAAREQVRIIIPVIREALCKASRMTNSQIPKTKQIQNSKIQKWAKENIDSIAVAHGPGLIGSLLIGVETAKALAVAWDKPLIAVDHLVGHVYANWLGADVNSKSLMVDGENKNPDERLTINDEHVFPLVALIVSGGHTDLVLVKGHGNFKLLGSTLDDAAGEAFDKVAKLLGLGYPGGPEVEQLARQLTVNSSQLTVRFPRPMINSKSFDFSFSGLKTAVVNSVNGSIYSSSNSEENKLSYSSSNGDKNKFSYSSRDPALGENREVSKDSSRNARTITDNFKAEVAAEFQRAAVDVLVAKTIRAAGAFDCKTIAVGGGVAANELLRSQLADSASRLGIEVLFPSKNLAVDNGAMIAAAAFFVGTKVDPLRLQANPGLHF